MSRRILFKAKRRDGEGWKEGCYWRTQKTTYCFKEDYDSDPENTEHYLLFDQMTDCGLPNQKFKMDIDPETLCQYTGLTDKNGQEIWENDILVQRHKGIVTVKYHVVFDLAEGAWMLETKSGARYGIGVVNQKNYEVIGNIFDNPELLEEE